MRARCRFLRLVENRERKWQKQDNKREGKKKAHTYNGALKKEIRREPGVYKRGGGREGERQRLLQLVQSAGSR